MSGVRAGDVVLGLGGTVDHEVDWDGDAVQRAVDEHGLHLADLTAPPAVASERDLLRVLLVHLRDGSGGERFVDTVELVESFAARFTPRTALGGTSVRAGLVMARAGVPSTLHLVSVDDHVRRSLPPQCSYVCSALEDSTHPHLVLQFPAGAGVVVDGVRVVAPRADRVILVNDPPNARLELSPALPALLERCSVLLLSGLNTLQDDALLAERLAQVRALRRRCPGAFVVYEDAAFHRAEHARAVAATMVGVADVVSLNEDEVAGHLGRRFDLADVDDVARALRDLRPLLPAPTLVVHTGEWALAVGREAVRLRSALLAGVVAASARYLHGDGASAQRCAELGERPVDPGAAGFALRLAAAVSRATGDGPAACVPVWRLRSASPTTVGLGDAFVGGFLTDCAERLAAARDDGTAPGRGEAATAAAREGRCAKTGGRDGS